MLLPSRRPLVLLAMLAAGCLLMAPRSNGSEARERLARLVRGHCTDCHGQDLAEARINLEQLLSADDLGEGFKDWEKVVRMLRDQKMPPPDSPQPTASERKQMIEAIESSLAEFIAEHAGDPGPVVIRRLTSAEYDYTIQDLTGLRLQFQRGFVSDAVGGEGFTNVGGAQFMQDSTLERYVEAARQVAEHVVIGAGPLRFFADPGQTGRELSAIHRIQALYRQHGFRAGAGEGAEPFGLDLYPRAFLVAWQYQHRQELGQSDVELAALAAAEGISPRFCQHIWSVLQQADSTFPISTVAAAWKRLPKPPQSEAAIRAACEELADVLREWQRTLAAAAGDEEEAAVLTEGEVRVQPTHEFTAAIDWVDGAESAVFELSVSAASNETASDALVIWRNPRLRFQRQDNRRGEDVSLADYLAPETFEQLKLGVHPTGRPIGETDFVLRGDTTMPIELRVTPGMIAARLRVDVELDLEHGADRIVRCRIADGEVEGETAAEVGETSALLADPHSPVVARWQSGVAEFARLLPAVSHREPAPSDRDPIPEPYDNTYNMPERNQFHYAIKYHRDDRFLVEKILDDDARWALDDAWTDLLTSFEYHDANLRFLAQKFGLDLPGRGIAELNDGTLAAMPDEPRAFAQRWRDEYRMMQERLRTAEPRHVDDLLPFAERAWRRPLSGDEQQRLRKYYAALRQNAGLDHAASLRAVLTRILVSPAFLYRAEPSTTEGLTALDDWELASRLSYFLWSSLPDDELRRAAAAGELRDPEQLAGQARRMLRDPKARRLAEEFFGQWFGFYRFDEYRGIDVERFPEFSESLKADLYDEAVSFFEHIVREDRPVSEILFADYTFVNAPLARHYGLSAEGLPAEDLVRVEGVSDQHRGGLLGLGAVHAVTSAPLRTSPVKRGDWVLRRVVGTPVPPPPADAGSIAADDVATDGLTVRARLETHRTNAACVNCHSRIDPLGFAWEHYDPIGRWREIYRDGQAIDAAGTLNDGTEIVGLPGLYQYLRREQPQFERLLSGKLLGYALGRTELASDRPLLEQMLDDLRSGGRFSDLVTRIVVSQQFRYRRS